MILTAGEQREVEKRAEELGVSMHELMDSAGRAVYETLRKQGPLAGKTAVILCGKGGNGGDGFVCARLLAREGALPAVILCGGVPKGETAARMYTLALSEGVPMCDGIKETERTVDLIDAADIVVDAVYGIGFKGELPPAIAKIFDLVSARPGKYTVAVDLPSGVDADTGAVAEHTLCADCTVTVLALKPAHLFKNAKRYCGDIVFAEIGVPEGAYRAVKPSVYAIDQALATILMPSRNETGHKGTFGRLVCAVGSERYPGAGVISVTGALAGGAGFVYAVSSANVLSALAAKCPEAIQIDFEKYPDDAKEAVANASACLVGCGIGLDARAEKLVAGVMKGAKGTVVLDADALKIVCADKEYLAYLGEHTIITPHPGEFSDITGQPVGKILEDRITAARRYAEEHETVVVLKSENTVVALPDREVYVNTIGNAGLAKGGSGDLLAGIIASLAAMGMHPEYAAILGVWLHSRAADLLARRVHPHSMTASAVAECIGEAMLEL